MILTDETVTPEELAQRTGWVLKPQGLCRGDVCVPTPDLEGRSLDVHYLSQRLGAPLLHDEEAGVWALGPSTATGRALDSAELPRIVLPDVRTGEEFDLADLRGRRVLLIAWASW